MKKTVFLLVLLLIFSGGCGISKEKSKGKTAIRIGNIKISAKEFEERFQEALASREDNPEARRKFLDELINKKLILKEAEKKGLDRKKEFLKDVEEFWERTLLRDTLDLKSNEIACSVRVSDREVKKYYRKLHREGLATEPLSKVYNEVKRQALRNKELGVFEEWANELRNNTKIEINYQLLGIE